jgi:type IV pilus assembly protein PilF
MWVKNIAVVLSLLLGGCVVVQEGPTQNEKASKINVQLGIGYYNQNNLEQASQKLLKALDQDPDSAQAHHAYAVLQNRFLDREKADFHFRKSIELDANNSEALNNYGAFLCQDERYEEARSMFLKAVKNPLYKFPEVAYTNAAICLRKGGLEPDSVKEYLRKALGSGRNFGPALLTLADIGLEEGQPELTSIYIRRYHLGNQPGPRSLWLKIRAEHALGNADAVEELGQLLKKDFPDSAEYQSWLELSK